LRAEGLVHVFAEAGAVLEALEVDDAVLMPAEVSHQAVLRLRRVAPGSSSGVDEDLQRGVWDVLVGAGSGHVVLGGPSQTYSLSRRVLGHGEVVGVGGAQWRRRIVHTSAALISLEVESSVLTEKTSGKVLVVPRKAKAL